MQDLPCCVTPLCKPGDVCRLVPLSAQVNAEASKQRAKLACLLDHNHSNGPGRAQRRSYPYTRIRHPAAAVNGRSSHRNSCWRGVLLLLTSEDGALGGDGELSLPANYVCCLQLGFRQGTGDMAASQLQRWRRQQGKDRFLLHF